MSAGNYVPVYDLEELEAEGRAVVPENGRAGALFYREGEVHAADNRCAHEGFPLVRGAVEEGILTCHCQLDEYTDKLLKRGPMCSGLNQPISPDIIEFRGNTRNHA